ncbi:MAG: hypothetical protein CMK92_00755 [Pseudomonas sp.]|nr:hypothetical protein [Pseudomonas sp.]
MNMMDDGQGGRVLQMVMHLVRHYDRGVYPNWVGRASYEWHALAAIKNLCVAKKYCGRNPRSYDAAANLDTNHATNMLRLLGVYTEEQRTAVLWQIADAVKNGEVAETRSMERFVSTICNTPLPAKQ